MKAKLLLLLLCFASLKVMGQGTISRQKTNTASQKKMSTSNSGKATTVKRKVSSKEKPVVTDNVDDIMGFDVNIMCNVSNAIMYIDGTNYGTASGSRFLKNGTHRVKLESAEYEDYQDSIYVDSNHKSFSFIMQKKEQLPIVEEEVAVVEQDDDVVVINDTPDVKDKLTSADLYTLRPNPEIFSTIINGKRFYYSLCSGNPNFAVIVEKKNAYSDFQEVILPETFLSDDGKNITIVGISEKAFYKCKKIRRVVLPGSVIFIGSMAFAGCNVEEVTFNKGLISIGEGAFCDNNLLDIYLPEGVEEIGSLAFFALKSTVFSRAREGKLYVPKTVSKIGDHAFAMTKNGYGAWFNSKRDILCLPNFVSLDNCKVYGISKDSVKEYLPK